MDQQSPFSQRRFSLSSLFYPATLYAVSVALFGTWGLLHATIVAAIWFSAQVRVLNLAARFVAVIVVLLVAISSALPPIYYPHYAGCWNNTQLIAVALHKYQAVNGSFPPAVIKDDQGRPMHSWRVLILRELGWPELYDEYDFDEPWNGPNNRKLADKMPSIYKCPHCNRRFDHPEHQTGYVAAVGPRAAWTPDQQMKFGNITDEHDRTILLVETPESPVHWMEPTDPSLAKIEQFLTKPQFNEQFDGHQDELPYWRHIPGRAIGFVNAKVAFSAGQLDPKLVTTLLQRDDELPAPEAELDQLIRPHHRLRYDRLSILALFVVVALYPLRWTGSKRNNDSKGSVADIKESGAGQGTT